MSGEFEDKLAKLTPRYTLRLELNGKPLITEKIALLLKLIDETGSILSASKSLNVPYSRAWEWISKVERVLQTTLIERRVGGGGGAVLTNEGRKLLDFYLSLQKPIAPMRRRRKAELVFAGSHDPLLGLLFGFLKANKEIHWVGSLAGLMSLAIGDSDVTGIHLLDPETGIYNVPYVRKFGLKEKIKLYSGFQREIGIAYHPSIKIERVSDLFDEEVRFVNRNPGSGSRILLEALLEEEAKKRKLSYEEVRRRLKGYDSVAWTHYEVVEAINAGKANAGITLRHVAESYGLNFLSLKWEEYDIAVNVDSLKKRAVKELLGLLKSDRFLSILKEAKGYKFKEDIGKEIEV